MDRLVGENIHRPDIGIRQKFKPFLLEFRLVRLIQRELVINSDSLRSASNIVVSINASLISNLLVSRVRRHEHPSFHNE